MREIDWRIKSISDRQDRKLEFNAALHGIKLKGTKKRAEGPQLTEEQDESLSKVIEERMQRGLKNGRR